MLLMCAIYMRSCSRGLLPLTSSKMLPLLVHSSAAATYYIDCACFRKDPVRGGDCLTLRRTDGRTSSQPGLKTGARLASACSIPSLCSRGGGETGGIDEVGGVPGEGAGVNLVHGECDKASLYPTLSMSGAGLDPDNSKRFTGSRRTVYRRRAQTTFFVEEHRHSSVFSIDTEGSGRA